MNTPPAPPPPAPPRRKLYGLPLIIPGAIIAAAGFIILVSGSQQYDLCNSGLGQLGQAVNATARANCQQDDIGHNVCMVVVAAGLGLVLWGVIRLFYKRGQQVSPPHWQG